MARYISEEDFIQGVEGHYCTDCDNYGGVRCRACWIDDAIGLVENTPTADVVPKSEVEELKADLEVWKQNRFNIFQMLELYKMTKQEVASEIFEEIEKNISPMLGLENDKEYVAILSTTFAELKKKYVEGEPNGN